MATRLILITIIVTFTVPHYTKSNDLNLGNLADIFAALGGGTGCVFKCPGGHLPKQNPKHRASSNGCGSHGIKISAEPGFEECCNKHDICYDTCNEEREECDKVFKECLKDTCHMESIVKKHSREKRKECEGSADMMHAGALGLGCAAYKEAQRNACLCNGEKISKQKMKEMEQLNDEL